MDLTTFERSSFLLAFAMPACYSLLRIWRRGNGPEPMDGMEGFRPAIGFTRLDGMASLSLLLANGSGKSVWAEEIEIFLSDLRADQQTAEPSCHETQTIRQMVQRSDTLPISLCELIYRAAGKPQRKYSCVIASVLRYRVDEKQYEKRIEDCRVHMNGLTTSSVHVERKPQTGSAV